MTAAPESDPRLPGTAITFAFIEKWRSAALQAHARGEINASAFVVAYALSGFVNRNTGRAWPSVATLAERVGAAIHDDDSRAVRVALTALSAAGLIEKKGRGRGKSNGYSLRLPSDDSDGPDRHMSAGQDSSDRHGYAGEEASDRHNYAATTGITMPPNLYIEPDSPTTTFSAVPARVGLEKQHQAEPPQGAFEGSRNDFRSFLGVYPVDASMDIERARIEFLKLPIADRAAAVDGARAYAAAMRARGRDHPRDAARWLAAREFDLVEEIKLAKLAGKLAKLAGTDSPLVFVAKDSPAWEAWTKARGKRPPTCREPGGTREGWMFPAPFPPSHGREAFFVERGEIAKEIRALQRVLPTTVARGSGGPGASLDDARFRSKVLKRNGFSHA